MTINTSTIKQMLEQGLTGESHHMKLKAAYKALTGEVPSGEDLEQVRTALTALSETPDVADPDETPAKAPKQPKEKVAPHAPSKQEEKAAREALQAKYPSAKIVRVTEVNGKGKGTRCVIQCADCKTEREIASQDLFQVKRCGTCQRKALQAARNDMAKKRRAARTEAKKATVAK